MVGIRSQESEKFERFFEAIQESAKKMNCVFFLDCGEGHELSTETLEGEDLTGWLIPNSKADEFGKLFVNGDDLDEWADFLAFCRWSFVENRVSFSFERMV